MKQSYEPPELEAIEFTPASEVIAASGSGTIEEAEVYG